jgi:hypothetical protein
MKRFMLALIATIGLSLMAASTASAQYAQYNPPFTYGSNTYYFNPNTGYNYVNSGSAYTSNYIGPTVYGPGYTASYPYMYNQMNYGYRGYYPGYTTYRTYRYWR